MHPTGLFLLSKIRQQSPETQARWREALRERRRGNTWKAQAVRIVCMGWLEERKTA